MNGTRRQRSASILPILIALVMIAGVGAGVLLAPRLFDRTPPEVNVHGLEAASHVGGVRDITIIGQDTKAGLREAVVWLDRQRLARLVLHGKKAQETFRWDTTTVDDGVHLLRIVVSDASLWGGNERALSYDVITDNTPSELIVRLVPSVVRQGQTLAIFVESNETLREAQAMLGGRDIALYPRITGHRALVGIPHDASPGIQPLLVKATDLAGNTSTFQTEWTLRQGQFRTGVVNLSSKKQGLLTDADKKQLNRRRRSEALATSQPQQLWRGRFQKPADGVTTSPFGTRRVYNDGILRSVHLGWDIANREGTPVVAANDGIVVLAEELPIHGKNVLIDHGEGVFSGYGHLDAILVHVGEKVTKGQPIGRMGSTGQSTGPHLHWEMFVQGVPVDPAQWLTQDFGRIPQD